MANSITFKLIKLNFALYNLQLQKYIKLYAIPA